MGLKSNWKDLIDGESLVEVEPINRIAHAIIDNEDQDQERDKTISNNKSNIEKAQSEAETDRISIATNKANIEANRKSIASLASQSDRNDKRLTTLESVVYGDLAQETEDNTVAYVKDVPSNARGTAKLNTIGGMTYKDGNVLRSAPVTEVESVGVNMFDINAPHINVEGGTYRYEMFGKPNTKYTFSTNVPQGNPANIYANGGSTITHGIYEGHSLTTTTDENGRMYCEVRYSAVDTGIDVYTGLLNGTYNLMVNKGTTAQPYRPYTRNALHIPEAVRPAHGIPNGAYDSIEWCEDRTRKSYKRIEQTVINTVAEAPYSYTNIKYFAVPKPTDFIGYGAISNSFIVPNYDVSVIISGWDDASNIGKATGSATYTEFWFGFPIGTTLEQAKSALIDLPMIYELATPEVTDISDILPADNYIGVEGGGTLTFKNQYEFDVPSEVTYITKGATV